MGSSPVTQTISSVLNQPESWMRTLDFFCLFVPLCMYEQELSCSFLLCRLCVRNIFHSNTLAGFFSVVVSAPKARQFQIAYKLIVYLYHLLAVFARPGHFVHIYAVNLSICINFQTAAMNFSFPSCISSTSARRLRYAPIPDLIDKKECDKIERKRRVRNERTKT